MTLRQKERKAAQRQAHATGADTSEGRALPEPRPEDYSRGALWGPVQSKPTARKTRRLIVRASRKANRR